MRRAASLLVIVLFAGAASAASGLSEAPPYEHWQKLGATRASGAVAIAADGRTVVVGDSIAEPCPAPGYVCRGAAAVFVLSGSQWRRVQRLAPADRRAGFGASVAISADGGVLVVGAYRSFGDEDSLAVVSVYARTGSSWKLAQKLTSTSLDRHFGDSVAVSGDGRTIVVGDEPGSALDDGVTHVYARSGTGWDEAATLQGPSGPGDFTFGRTVAVSSDGSTILVLAADTGFVFVFSAGSWQLAGSLVPAGDRAFLSTAALSPDGTVAVLTDDDPSGNVSGPGRAYVFTRSGSSWSKAQTIVEPGRPREWNEFGDAVAVSRRGQTLLFGAPLTGVGSKPDSFDRGVVHVFGRAQGGWRRTQTLGVDRKLGDFGLSVALTPDATRIVVGSLDPAVVVSR